MSSSSGAAQAPTLPMIRRAIRQHQPDRQPQLGLASAVLVPLLPRAGGLDLLFTERSKDLRSHPGQVSFPGGRVDPADKDVRAAALREAREEVGLSHEHVEIIGELDDCPTFVTGFVITPVVGVIDPLSFTDAGRYPWKPSAAEIASLHELPLADFLDPGNRRTELRKHDGEVFELIWYTVRGTTVWGATARIVRQLIDLSLQET